MNNAITTKQQTYKLNCLGSIRKYGFTCINCGSYKWNTELLCPFCLESFENFYHPQIHYLDEIIKVYTAYDWRPFSNSVLDQLIVALKGGQTDWTFHWLVQKFLTGYFENSFNKNYVFIPAPSLRPLNKDHAYKLANVFHFYLNGKIEVLLKKDTPFEQKRLSLLGRRELRVKLNQKGKKTNKRKPNEKIILIDDVLTTGATVRACWVALGKPKNFESWVLFRRVKSDLL